MSYTTVSYSWRVDSGLEFEWDPAKADANFRKRGVSFETAARVFADPGIISARHATAQERRRYGND